MKTAISIDDNVFKQAEITAKQLGLSRSKLYTLAIDEYVQNHKPDSITEKLNAIYSENDSSLEDDVSQLNYELLSKVEW